MLLLVVRTASWPSDICPQIRTLLDLLNFWIFIELCSYGQINAGGSINNALEISRHFNEDRILVCNNDQCLKIYSLPSLSEAAIITYPTPINASAISPDGSKMVTVGDTSDIFFHGLNSPASTIPEYKLVSTLKATNDASFSISWNPSSSVFAVGSQDGFVSVFDVRKLGQKLALLKSFQNHRDRQAVRKVTFSPSGSIDLLAFSEVYFLLLFQRSSFILFFALFSI